jgi:hypothetical protein
MRYKIHPSDFCALVSSLRRRRVDRVLDDLLEFLELVGLLEDGVETETLVVAHDRVLEVTAAGDDLGVGVDLLDRVHGVLPADAVGDDKIHHDDIERLALRLGLGEGGDGLRAIGAGRHLVAEVAKHAADDIENHLLVVHEQDAAFHRRLDETTRAGHARRAPGRGVGARDRREANGTGLGTRDPERAGNAGGCFAGGDGHVNGNGGADARRGFEEDRSAHALDG